MSLKQSSAPKHPDALRRLRVAAFIPLLLGSRGPSAVIRRVGAVVVDAVQRMIGRWASPHVLQERLVGRAPLVTDANTTPAITRIPLVARIVTAVPHIDPRLIFARPCASSGITVRGLSGASFLAMVATATDCLSSSQGASGDDPFRAALATAAPMRSWVSPLCLFDDGQSSKPSAYRVDDRSGHLRPIITGTTECL